MEETLMNHYFRADNTASLARSNLQNILKKTTFEVREVGDWCMKKPSTIGLLETYNVTFELTNPRNCVTSQHCLGVEMEAEDYLLGYNPGYVHYSPWGFYKQWLKQDGTYPYTYGQRGGTFLPEVIDKLTREPSTRHCVVNLWEKFQDFRKPFVPCTTQWHFQIVDGKLVMTTTMRSQDACRGFFLDTFAYPLIQQYVAKKLDRPMGSYYHTIINSHVYLDDLTFARKILHNVREMGDLDFPLLSEDDKAWMNDISHALFIDYDHLQAEKLVKNLPKFWADWKRNQIAYAYTKYIKKDPLPTELTIKGVIINVL